jgi:hypothetical protein
MDIQPAPPAVYGADDGAVTVFSSKYARNIVLMATEAMGGVEGLVEWAKSSPDRTDSFWTKLFPKTITKEIAIDDKRSVEDIIDALDAAPVAISHNQQENVPSVVDAEWENDEEYT